MYTVPLDQIELNHSACIGENGVVTSSALILAWSTTPELNTPG